VTIAGTLVTRVMAETDDFERGMQRTRREVQQTSNTITTSSNQWKASLLSGATFGAIRTESITRFLDDLDRAAAKVEATRASLARVAGSDVGGGDAFALVRQSADAAGAGLFDLSKQYERLATVTRGTSEEGRTTSQLFTAIGALVGDASTELDFDLLAGVRIVAALLADILASAWLHQAYYTIEDAEGFIDEAIPATLDDYLASSSPFTTHRPRW
jgi:hypothetical protein